MNRNNCQCVPSLRIRMPLSMMGCQFIIWKAWTLAILGNVQCQIKTWALCAAAQRLLPTECLQRLSEFTVRRYFICKCRTKVWIFWLISLKKTQLISQYLFSFCCVTYGPIYSGLMLTLWCSSKFNKLISRIPKFCLLSLGPHIICNPGVYKTVIRPWMMCLFQDSNVSGHAWVKISILPLSTIFLLHLSTVPKVRYFSVLYRYTNRSNVKLNCAKWYYNLRLKC